MIPSMHFDAGMYIEFQCVELIVAVNAIVGNNNNISNDNNICSSMIV